MNYSDNVNLAARVRASFSERTQPLQYGRDHGWESEDIDKFFKGRRWQDVTALLIWHESRAGELDTASFLDFMTDECFCYFLPAYMQMVLLEYSTAPIDLAWISSPVFSSLIAYEPSFQDGDSQKISLAKLKKYSLLTNEQKNVVADFLLHQTKHNGILLAQAGSENKTAQLAFNSYWHQFASQEAP